VLVAWGEVHNWGVFLRFLYQVPYGASDPLYDKDIGFYLFALPAYVVIKNWMLLTLLLSALFAGAIYWVRGHIEYDAQRRSMSPTAIAHGSVLLGFFFVVKAWSYGLDRYLLLYHDNGVVVGASYTDIHVELPVLWLLTGLSIVAAFAAWANLRVRTYRLPAAAAVLVFGGSVVLSGLIPGLFQRLFVKPNELQLEKPYIERNISADPARLQSPSDHGEAVPRRTGPHVAHHHVGFAGVAAEIADADALPIQSDRAHEGGHSGRNLEYYGVGHH